MRGILALTLSVLLGSSAFANGAPPAAGRIEGDDGGTCGGVLIAPDLVATAAHCVSRRNPPKKSFRPGGFPKPGVGVRAVRGARHPLYHLPGIAKLQNLRFDIALLRLGSEVRPDLAEPLPIGPPARPGEVLRIVTWPKTFDDVYARDCLVLSDFPGLATLTCPVQGGESGSAVIRMTAEGPELVAILVARTWSGILPVALAANLDGRVDAVQGVIDGKD